MKIRLSVPCFALGVLVGICACKASVEGKLETGGEDRSSDIDEPLDSRLTANQSQATDSQGIALLGARQDLSYRGPATTQCKCLAVATGVPGNAAFQWSGARPQISTDSQLVVALSSSGITCPEAGANPPGASYWGYEVKGNDVVVVVETASPTHPLASGAIIPRPAAGGQVYVRPLDKGLPYGLPASGTGTRCQVGNTPAQTPSTAPPFVTDTPGTTPATTESPAPATVAPPKLKGIKK